ncbi:MAG: rod shape-determining protein RodA [Muribaculaceae bacterium]|nr:rod shape-determining protein RodA [Muribaculaceae bacterium]
MLPKPNDSNSQSILRSVDWTTVVIYLLMVAAGVISIYAASYDFDEASLFSFDEFSGKQIRWIGLGLILGLFILLIDVHIFETYAYPIYVAFLVILFITPFIAPDIKGSRSWITIGPMSLQPAEFAKCATALALSKLFAGYNFSLNAEPINYVKALAIILVPVLLILLQNETGSALAYMALFFVLYREGMSGLILFAAAMAVVVFVVAVKYTEPMLLGVPQGEYAVLLMVMVIMVGMSIYYERRFDLTRNLLIWFGGWQGLMWLLAGPFGLTLPGRPILIGIVAVACVYLSIEALKRHVMKLFIPVATAVLAIGFMFSVNFAFQKLQPHQQLRILVVLGIEEDLRGAGYNVNQSKIAIGSGGLTGKGFLNGTQTKLKYVPEQHTDFIFCTIGEEEGFMGSLIVMGLYLALVLKIIAIAERQPRVFGRVYAYCVAAYFIFHFCINIGMVIGLCPVIGIPLPFFSYGGSSLWGFTLLLFILLRIDAARKAYH